jgi:hypothetical protein
MRRYNNLGVAPRGSKWVRVTGKFKYETDRAACFEYVLDGEVWFPKSKMYCIDNGVTQLQFYVQKWLLSDRSKGNK